MISNRIINQGHRRTGKTTWLINQIKKSLIMNKTIVVAAPTRVMLDVIRRELPPVRNRIVYILPGQESKLIGTNASFDCLFIDQIDNFGPDGLYELYTYLDERRNNYVLYATSELR